MKRKTLHLVKMWYGRPQGVACGTEYMPAERRTSKLDEVTCTRCLRSRLARYVREEQRQATRQEGGDR